MSTNPQNGYENQNGHGFCKYFHGENRKRHISKSKTASFEDVFCLWDTNEDNIKEIVKRTNHYHHKIKFTAEITDSEIALLDTKLYKGERFNRDSTLNVQMHYKQTETFQYTNFYSCHPRGIKKGFIHSCKRRGMAPPKNKFVTLDV